MINTLHTHEGFIYAYTVWRMVNEDGVADNEGRYIYVEDLWIHKAFRGGKALKRLIKLIDSDPASGKGEWVYWQRTKYNKRLSSAFPREIARKKGV